MFKALTVSPWYPQVINPRVINPQVQHLQVQPTADKKHSWPSISTCSASSSIKHRSLNAEGMNLEGQLYLQQIFSFQQWWSSLFQTKQLICCWKQENRPKSIFKNLFEGIKEALRQQDLEKSGSWKEWKVNLVFIGAFPFGDLLVDTGSPAEQRFWQSHRKGDTETGIQGSTMITRSSGKHPWLSILTTKGLQSI